MTWESGFTCTDPVRAFLHWGLPHTRITWDIQILNQHIIKHKCQPHSKSAMQSKPLAASDVTNFLGAIKTHPPVLVCISPEELTPFESVLKKNYLLTSHIPHFMINNVFNKGLHLWFIHQRGFIYIQIFQHPCFWERIKAHPRFARRWGHFWGTENKFHIKVIEVTSDSCCMGTRFDTLRGMKNHVFDYFDSGYNM